MSLLGKQNSTPLGTRYLLPLIQSLSYPYPSIPPSHFPPSHINKNLSLTHSLSLLWYSNSLFKIFFSLSYLSHSLHTRVVTHFLYLSLRVSQSHALPLSLSLSITHTPFTNWGKCLLLLLPCSPVLSKNPTFTLSLSSRRRRRLKPSEARSVFCARLFSLS